MHVGFKVGTASDRGIRKGLAAGLRLIKYIGVVHLCFPTYAVAKKEDDVAAVLC